MTINSDTRKTFRAAIKNVLLNMGCYWKQPVIYAYHVDYVLVFDSANRLAVGPEVSIWCVVEADTFRELSGCLDDDVDGIESNMFEQACVDVIPDVQAMDYTAQEISIR